MKDLDSLLSLLVEKKKLMEQDEVEASMQIMLEFLHCLRKRKLEELKQVETPEDILKADRLIFPGVGAFAPVMDVLNEKGMAEALCTYIQSDRPFLGICLGLQLLFESSEEKGPVFEYVEGKWDCDGSGPSGGLGEDMTWVLASYYGKGNLLQ